VTALAKRYGAILHVHADAEPIAWLYRIEPDLTILWAHAGLTEGPDVIRPLLQRYPTLYADTSYREYDILDGGIEGIDADWWDLINDFPDRFMIGSDTWVNGQWARYEEIMRVNRRWLSNFSRPVAEKIAYKNAARLFKQTIRRELLGTR